MAYWTSYKIWLELFDACRFNAIGSTEQNSAPRALLLREKETGHLETLSHSQQNCCFQDTGVRVFCSGAAFKFGLPSTRWN